MNNDCGILIKLLVIFNNKYFVENMIMVCMLCDFFVFFLVYCWMYLFFKNFVMYIFMNIIYVFFDICIVFNNYDLYFMWNIKLIVW